MVDDTLHRADEERDVLGRGTGVEVEQVESTDAQPDVNEPFDPDKIEVQTRQMTVDLLLSRLRHHAIDLDPEFQRRRGIWTDQRQSRLIESILLKIPLPTLYAAEDENEDWVIVDGIQRLTAIGRFVDHEAINDTRLELSGLEYLGQFTGKRFEDLIPRLKRRVLETELVVHVIRHGTPDSVKDNIFARINTGGLPLSRQELRHALISGKARALLRDWAKIDEFQRATAGSVPDDRMTDRELVLRFVAFRLTPPQIYRSGDFDRFLGDAMRKLSNLDDVEIQDIETAFKAGLSAAYEIFGRDAFRKRYREGDGRYPINKALFEAVAVNLAALDSAQRATLVDRKQDVIAGFIGLMNYRNFDDAISQGTGDIRKVHTRFGLFEIMLRKILEC